MAPLKGDRGIRSRNFSKLRGHRVYEYEYLYVGKLHHDIVTNVTVYFDVLSSTVESYKAYEASLFKKVQPDCTFEVYSLLKVYYSHEDLQRSIHVILTEDNQDFKILFESTDLIQNLRKVLQDSDLAVDSFYCDYTHESIDGHYDHFDLHLVVA